jgi:hypothetical protein
MIEYHLPLEDPEIHLSLLNNVYDISEDYIKMKIQENILNRI